jgi:hypothetical protein
VLDISLDSALAGARAAAAGRRANELPASVLRVEAANAEMRAVVYLRSIDGRIGPAGPEVSNASGDVLVKLLTVR